MTQATPVLSGVIEEIFGGPSGLDDDAGGSRPLSSEIKQHVRAGDHATLITLARDGRSEGIAIRLRARRICTPDGQ